MRTEKWLVLCIALLLIQLVACERGKMEENAPVPVSARTGTDSTDTAGTVKPYIVLDNPDTIRARQPATFKFVGGKKQKVVWRTVPFEFVLNNHGTSAVVTFQNPGNYRVLAVDSLGTDTAYLDVVVKGSINTIPNYDQAIQEGDQLYLTPTSNPDTANFLGIRIATAKQYECSNSYLQIHWPEPGNGLTVDVKGVVAGNRCDSGKTTAKAFLTAGYINVENYTKNFEIRFQNKTYRGSFKKTGKHFEFTWPYDSGVVFTTKTL
ncbi:hypothetical protein [Dyadobacter sp. 22481]|uniref:hypothetical protein n=1 Tax=Dyadobacter sp. 22481 TaxID=3453926 RepID=UPI003F84B0F6